MFISALNKAFEGLESKIHSPIYQQFLLVSGYSFRISMFQGTVMVEGLPKQFRFLADMCVCRVVREHFLQV